MKKERWLYAFDYYHAAGFCSELNNLLYALYYFQRHQLKYAIVSTNWISSGPEGWAQFFTSLEREHRALSGRHRAILKLHSFESALRRLLPNRLYEYVRPSLIRRGYNLLYNDFVVVRGRPTFHLVREYARQQRERDLSGFQRNLHHLSNSIWCIQPRIAAEVSRYLPPTPHYTAIHVRRGDKITEREDREYAIDEYIQVLKNLPVPSRDLFIMSDDQRVVDEFRELLPECVIHRGPEKTTEGYSQHVFQSMDRNARIEATEQLIVEIEIARQATYFLGTFNSNVFRLLDYLRDHDSIDISGLQQSPSEL